MKFKMLEKEERENLEKNFYEIITKKFQKEKIAENYHWYELTLQDIKFKTDMTDHELEQSITVALDMMEELKRINNMGIGCKELKKLQSKGNEDELIQLLDIWRSIRTEELQELLRKADQIQRVGGAWAALISNPVVISAIEIVFETQVDKFDDWKLYVECTYFLLRSILKMHGREYEEKD